MPNSPRCAPCVVGARDGAKYGDFAIKAEYNFFGKNFPIFAFF